MRNILTFQNNGCKIVTIGVKHPAPFPKELPYRCIKLFSYQNDLVFDPFVGSGTTLLVAQNIDRKSIGVELDIQYCELAKNRILKEIGSINFEINDNRNITT